VVRFRRCDGSWQTFEVACTCFSNGSGKTGAVITFQDPANRQAQTAPRRHSELHDSLTDLPSRTLFFDLFQRELVVAHRKGKPFALLVLSLNHFREINGTFGYQWGDVLLQQVGTRLCNALRKSDIVARLSGDEFAILLPTTGDLRGATRTAHRILSALEQPFAINGHSLHIRASIGIAFYPQHGVDANTLLRRADIARCTAKRTRGQYAIYAADQDQYTPNQLTLMSELHYAIKHDQLVLHYQPKVHCATGQVMGVEALVRWKHPKYGLLSPDQFIPLAEKTGLINPLGLQVLNAALRQCQAWRQEGLDLRVAINLSMYNLHDPKLVDAVAKQLDLRGGSPDWLEVEITESVLSGDPAQAVETLTRLHTMGVQISIDDFGTGYSTLAHLKQLPANAIKIDKSFVIGMPRNDQDAAIVRSIIDLGHRLGLTVIAEGVENRETYEQLITLQCDSAQGYYWSRPVPAPAFLRWLRERSRSVPEHRVIPFKQQPKIASSAMRRQSRI
jgi:diguanylate cyclase (GGDEF)-like protein